MKFDFTIGKFRISAGQPTAIAKRSFGGAGAPNRLNADWLMPRSSADGEIAGHLITLRNGGRELERTNEYVQRYLDLLENNVLGHRGVRLQMRIADLNGNTDQLANKVVAQAWEDWCSREYCTASGLLCFREVEALAIRRPAVDGAVLVRLLRGWGNKFGFAVQPLEMDHLDFDLNQTFPDGREIKFGIEFDQWHRILAFHLFKKHPGDTMNSGVQRERVPAKDILHIYRTERPGQTTGIPWIACVAQALEHLGKYQEAELVAARAEACKGYAIEQERPDGWSGKEDETGRQMQELSPAMALMLDPGQKYIPIDPTHPNTAHADYVKGRLRGIAAGLAINYNSLANDLESVNYSSMRAGKLEEVEEYKSIQGWLIENLHQPVFEAWLEMALLHGAIKIGANALPLSKFDKFNAPSWKPRRWPWVDPLKDLQASVMAVEKGFRSRQSIIAEMGDDIEEVFKEQFDDDNLADKYDLEFPIGANPQQTQADGEEAAPAKLTSPKE